MIRAGRTSDRRCGRGENHDVRVISFSSEKFRVKSLCVKVV